MLKEAFDVHFKTKKVQFDNLHLFNSIEIN